jgi:hypothetical protein
MQRKNLPGTRIFQYFMRSTAQFADTQALINGTSAPQTADPCGKRAAPNQPYDPYPCTIVG